MKPYYYIFNPAGNAPTRKHKTIDIALAESQRLAKLHPGQSFEICKVIGITQCTEPNTFWMDGEQECGPKYKIGDKVCATGGGMTVNGIVVEIHPDLPRGYYIKSGNAFLSFKESELEHV